MDQDFKLDVTKRADLTEIYNQWRGATNQHEVVMKIGVGCIIGFFGSYIFWPLEPLLTVAGGIFCLVFGFSNRRKLDELQEKIDALNERAKQHGLSLCRFGFIPNPSSPNGPPSLDPNSDLSYYKYVVVDAPPNPTPADAKYIEWKREKDKGPLSD